MEELNVTYSVAHILFPALMNALIMIAMHQ